MQDDYYLIVNCALRYALGRHTYICKTVADYIKSMHYIPQNDMEIMIRDIEQHLNNPIAMEYEHQCDYDTWVDLRDYLQNKINNLTTKSKTIY